MDFSCRTRVSDVSLVAAGAGSQLLLRERRKAMRRAMAATGLVVAAVAVNCGGAGESPVGPTPGLPAVAPPP
jgi:hypothetical protein